MRSEFSRGDLGKEVRGKYYSAYKESHNIALFDSEAAKVFPCEKVVLRR